MELIPRLLDSTMQDKALQTTMLQLEGALTDEVCAASLSSGLLDALVRYLLTKPAVRGRALPLTLKLLCVPEVLETFLRDKHRLIALATTLFHLTSSESVAVYRPALSLLALVLRLSPFLFPQIHSQAQQEEQPYAHFKDFLPNVEDGPSMTFDECDRVCAVMSAMLKAAAFTDQFTHLCDVFDQAGITTAAQDVHDYLTTTSKKKPLTKRTAECFQSLSDFLSLASITTASATTTHHITHQSTPTQHIHHAMAFMDDAMERATCGALSIVAETLMEVCALAKKTCEDSAVSALLHTRFQHDQLRLQNMATPEEDHPCDQSGDCTGDNELQRENFEDGEGGSGSGNENNDGIEIQNHNQIQNHLQIQDRNRDSSGESLKPASPSLSTLSISSSSSSSAPLAASTPDLPLLMDVEQQSNFATHLATSFPSSRVKAIETAEKIALMHVEECFLAMEEEKILHAHPYYSALQQWLYTQLAPVLLFHNAKPTGTAMLPWVRWTDQVASRAARKIALRANAQSAATSSSSSTLSPRRRAERIIQQLEKSLAVIESNSNSTSVFSTYPDIHAAVTQVMALLLYV